MTSAGSMTVHPVSRSSWIRPSGRTSSPVSFLSCAVGKATCPILLTSMEIDPDLPMRGWSRSRMVSPVISTSGCANTRMPWGSGRRHVSRHQVGQRLAADNQAGLAVADEHYRRAQRAVVVVGHGAAVRAGDRHGQQVAGARVAQRYPADQPVAGFAVPPDQLD